MKKIVHKVKSVTGDLSDLVFFFSATIAFMTFITCVIYQFNFAEIAAAYL